MKDVQRLQIQMQANMKKMTDPAYIKAQEAKRQEFGCEMIQMEAPPGGSIKGEMRCGQKVGTRIPVTGTMRSLGR